MTPSIVVFDIGNVLVDWHPQAAWLEELGTIEACNNYMERVGFDALNLRGDGGETFADMAREVDDREDARRLVDYVNNYPLTVPNQIPGTWAILDRLKARDVPTHAITNWSAETWPRGLEVHPRLGEVFGTLIISGEVKLLKPDPAIYRLFCETAGVDPADCVFVDDRVYNCDGAKSIGMDAIHFTGARALESDLTARGLL